MKKQAKNLIPGDVIEDKRKGVVVLTSVSITISQRYQNDKCTKEVFVQGHHPKEPGITYIDSFHWGLDEEVELKHKSTWDVGTIPELLS